LTALLSPEPALWSEAIRRTLERYEEPLLRQVAVRLCKPRNQWPADELIERCLAAVGNPAVIDRRLDDLEPPCVRLLALIGRSRCTQWRVGNLVEIMVALGHADGLAPVTSLLESGLLFPVLPGVATAAEPPSPTGNGNSTAARPRGARCRSFTGWLGQAGAAPPAIFAPPEITARACGLDDSRPLVPPDWPQAVELKNPAIHEADGLDWPLRLAALWQQMYAGPLRRTQASGFFKRDLDRLRGDGLLNAPPAECLLEIPDPALLAVGLAAESGLLRDLDGELHKGDFSPAWNSDLSALTADLWNALLRQNDWDPVDGWRPDRPAGNPRPSAWLLALELLRCLAPEAWADPAAVERWMLEHHPFWSGGNSAGIVQFLLGVAYPLRLVQTARQGKGPWHVRLSALGRWLLGGPPPPAPPSFPQTILVQPNLEILAYRQGLGPVLIARLAKLADWQTLGPACTLRIAPQSVYRALEAGESFGSILDLLQRYGMKALPDAVVSALRTWSSKRERIRVYPAGALFEFATADDLVDALARGTNLVRLDERLAVAPSDANLDFRQFRLTATRDYALPPDRCVDVAADGVTLAIDLAKSDLLVDTEIRRFAEPADRAQTSGRSTYHVTPESVARAQAGGLTLAALESWFHQRGGQELPPAVKLLFSGSQLSPYEIRKAIVFLVPSPEIADGLMQWPQTRVLLGERLGPTSLTVSQDNLPVLCERLQVLGIAPRLE
jgi:hypothetical protein